MNLLIKLKIIFYFLFITLLNLYICKATLPPDFETLFNKKSITILITDSGLGGLSICAKLEKNLREFKCFDSVKIIFFNALPDLNKTYNEMKTDNEKITVFENALESMINNFNPDILLIACNTLSVIYPKTRFFNNTKIPIIEIIDLGVNEIVNKMEKDSTSHVLICGTETTINSNIHKNALIKKGIDSSRIITAALKQLESEIQINPKSETVNGLIEMYLSEILEDKNSFNEKLFVALCCTHYGYSEELFSENLNKFVNNYEIINPNIIMSNILSNPKYKNRFDKTHTIVKAFSRVYISEDERNAIADVVRQISQNTAEALINYEYDKNLFNY